jgi:two-component system, OmpR family, sensor histidine kinase CreC
MKLSLRIFIGYFLIVGIGAYFLLNTVVSELKPGVRQSTEETLVDIANLLAEIVKDEVKNGTINNGRFAQSITDYVERDPNARIGGVIKSENNHRIYVTDAKGVVIFDSDGLDVGKDYSRWNDVHLTLMGKYGARSTREVPGDESSAVMHVAAPVLDGGKIIGVLTVAKPNVSIDPFIDLGKRKMVRAGLILLALSLAIGLLVTLWFARSINKLTNYAGKVSAGGRAALPDMGNAELNVLAKSMETMRRELDGKEYVENYVQTMTHEMKSPLAAIKAASELLDENLSEADRKKFLANIRGESGRLQNIIERMLDLAVVEQRQTLQGIATVSLFELVEEIIAVRLHTANNKKLNIINKLDKSCQIEGERFLLHQALANLIDNALDFTLAGGEIVISSREENTHITVAIHNAGERVPDYALTRVFERFYSLPRPDTGKKSTGLGLAFVREVANLHGGSIDLVNVAGGVEARLRLLRESRAA